MVLPRIAMSPPERRIDDDRWIEFVHESKAVPHKKLEGFGMVKGMMNQSRDAGGTRPL